MTRQPKGEAKHSHPFSTHFSMGASLSNGPILRLAVFYMLSIREALTKIS